MNREEELWEAFGNFCEAINSSLPKYKKMTVKELKSQLEEYPDQLEVFIAERKTEFAYGLVNSVRREDISFGERSDDGWDELAKDTVVILDEE